jgi:hypothetical protein
MLELVEESLDAVSEFIGLHIMRDLDFSVPFGWNDDIDLGVLDHLAQRIGIVSLIGDNAAGSLTIQQIGGSGDIVRLTAGQDEAQWPTFSVRDSVDFAGQSSSGTPQSLIFAPPFPFAACWWARTTVLSSMRY